MRKFIIHWKEKSKYGDSPVRKNVITLSKPTKDISLDAKAALNILTANYKSLKYIDVIEIQEIDENNKPIGEPIKPTDDVNIVPVGK